MDKELLSIYIETMNSIDDYFEYRHESDKDKAFVRKQLANMVAKLQNAAVAAESEE